MPFRRFRRLYLVIVCAVFTSFLYLLGLFNTSEVVEYQPVIFGDHQCEIPSTPMARQNGRERTDVRRKLILFYTNIFGRIPIFYPERLKCCEPFKCEITQDKNKLLESDAVVFHGRDMPTADKMPKQRTPNQRWIFYTLENPYNSKIEPRDYNEMFNWTMGYERRSDIFQPYGYYSRKIYTKEFTQKNYAAGKDKLVAYVNSHCRTAERVRENYIVALSRLVKVSVYGKCGGIFGRLMCPTTGEKCKKLLQRHKFYLAFENALCKDYISEKYWVTPILNNIVPVVYGGDDFKALAIPGSYIDVSEFANAESLSKYLKYLDKNDTAYNEYFKWTRFYQKANLEPWPCRLCRMLHNNSLPVHTYVRFDKILDPNSVCRKNIEHFEKYVGY